MKKRFTEAQIIGFLREAGARRVGGRLNCEFGRICRLIAVTRHAA